MKKERDGQKPGLANGKLPFTPIVHKQANEVGTPYQALHLADLDTPKPVKPAVPISIPEPRKADERDTDGLPELREALLICVDIVGRLERANESKVYRSVGTQTHSPAQGPPQPVRPLEATEVLFLGDSQSSPPSKPPLQQAKVRKPLAPRGNVSPPAKPDQTGSTDISFKGSDDPHLQKRIHEMSLLLKRLESQLDGMNAPV
jgi:hypothetical protein